MCCSMACGAEWICHPPAHASLVCTSCDPLQDFTSLSCTQMPAIPIASQALTVAVMQCTAPSPHAASGVICIPHVTSGIATTGRTGMVMGMKIAEPPSGPGGPAAQHSMTQQSTAQHRLRVLRQDEYVYRVALGRAQPSMLMARVKPSMSTALLCTSAQCVLSMSSPQHLSRNQLRCNSGST